MGNNQTTFEPKTKTNLSITSISRRVRNLFLSVILPAAVFLGGASVIEAATWEVINTNDSGPGSLREAVLVSGGGGDTIIFAPTLLGQTITLTSGQITVNTNMTIIGPGLGLLTISGNNASRVFYFSGGVSTISGLTIAYGRVVGGNGGAGGAGGGGGGGMGAGLLADASSTVSILDAIFASNTVTGGIGGANGSGTTAGSGGSGAGGSSGALAFPGEDGSYDGGNPGANPGGGGGGGGLIYGQASEGGNGSFGGGGGGGGADGLLGLPGGVGGTSAGFGGTGGTAGMFLTGGGGGGGAGLGGAVCVWQSALVILSNVILQANSAVGGSGSAGGQSGQGKGGAIFVYPGGVAEETNLTFSGNSSANGGSGILATDGLVTDNSDVYGSFLSLEPVTNTLVYASASVWTDFELENEVGGSFTDDTMSVPGEVVDWVANPDPHDLDGEAALKFDLSEVTGPVGSAFLRIHVCESFGTPYLSVYGSPDNSWTEASFTFPTNFISPLDVNDSTGLTAGDWKFIDVTSFVNSTLNNSGTASFALTNEVTGGYGGFVFDCYQSSIALLRPALIITPAAVLLTNTTMTVSGILNPSAWGDPVTLTATVTPASGLTAPTGLVSFSDGATLLGSASLIASVSGVTATFSATNLPVGDDVISAVYAGDTNFFGSSNQFTQIVNLAAQSALLFTPAASQTYGSSNLLSASGGSGLGAISYIVVSGPGQIVDGDSLVITNGSGEVTVEATKAADADYAATYTQATVLAVPAMLTIAANPQVMTYGAAMPTLTATFSGFANGDTSSNLTTQPTLTTSATNGSPVNVYQIFAGGAVDANYAFTYIAAPLLVTPAPLTITASNQVKMYGAALPSLTAGYTGFVNGDGPGNLIPGPTLITTATAGSHVSGNTFGITASGALDPNYAISYLPGTLTVTAAPLMITASNQVKIYGAALPPLTASFSGFVNDDTSSNLTTQPTLATIATATNPVGAYAITASGAFDSDYAISYTAGTLSVTPASLTGTTANQTRAYGQTNPVFTVSYSGFVNGDTTNALTGTLAFACLDTNSVPVGTNTTIGSYLIQVVTGQTAANYTVEYLPGTLSVTPAVLLVAPDNQSRLYGVTNPPLTATYSGFLNDDGTNVITGAPGLSTSADIFSPVGTYVITAIQGTLAATNYSFSFTNGVLTVGKAILTVAADNLSRIYGSTNPPLTYTLSGFVDGDGTNVLLGAPSLSTSADTNSPVGTYDIVATNGTLLATNYALNFTNGTLSVTPATLTATAMDQSRLYGSPNPALTISYSGFVNGQDTNAISSLPTASSTAETNSIAGSYGIILTGGSDTNYIFNLVDGTLTVTPVPLMATADFQTRTYGATNPALTISYSGFVNGDNAGVLQTPPTAGTTATPFSAVGSYPITLNGGSDPDYVFTLAPGVLSVTPAPVIATANNQTRAYGASNPELTFSSTGLANGEDPIVLGITLSTSANLTSPVGAYPIFAGGGTDPNYQVTTVNGVLTVANAPLTVTANGLTRPYGTANPPFTGTIVGLLNGDAISASFNSVALTSSPAGIYQIIPALVDPLNLSSNYNVVLVDAELNIVAALVLDSDPAYFVVGNGPIPLDTNAMVNDGDSINYAGGQLTVTIATNAGPDEALAVPSQGTGVGQIGVQGASVSYGGVAFATLDQTSNSLVFSLGTNGVASEMLTALLRQVTFNTDDTNTAFWVIQAVLNYGSNSVLASRTVLLDHPPVANGVVIVATKGATVTIPISELLTNVTDVDGNVITLENVDPVSDQGGRITVSGSTLTYRPPANLTGNADAFGVVYSDGHGGETVGFVTLQFLPPNGLQINATSPGSAGIQLTFSGTPGHVYQIQSSADLVNWVLLETVTATPTGLITLLDDAEEALPQQFYRAVAQ
jgi:hypothetical protein